MFMVMKERHPKVPKYCFGLNCVTDLHIVRKLRNKLAGFSIFEGPVDNKKNAGYHQMYPLTFAVANKAMLTFVSHMYPYCHYMFSLCSAFNLHSKQTQKHPLESRKNTNPEPAIHLLKHTYFP